MRRSRLRLFKILASPTGHLSFHPERIHARRSHRKFRLITALHYDRSIAYVLRFLTHADYDKNRWKSEL